MGIKASFSGSSGQSKAFDFDLPSDASRLAGFLGGGQDAQDNQRATPRRNSPDEDDGKVATKAGDAPDYLEKKIDSSGSIEIGANGMRLKGDADSGSGAGGFINRIYSMINGVRHWWTLRDIDPPNPGKIIGPAFGTNSVEAEPSSVNTDNSSAFSFLAVSRIATEVDDTANMETVYAFLREVQVSAGGRVIGIGPEQRQFIGNFLLHDPARIAVRPLVLGAGPTGNSTILAALQFGPADVLARQIRDGHIPPGVGLAQDLPPQATFTVRTNTCPNYTFGYAEDTNDGA